jgi:hypothetical protein
VTGDVASLGALWLGANALVNGNAGLGAMILGLEPERRLQAQKWRPLNYQHQKLSFQSITDVKSIKIVFTPLQRSKFCLNIQEWG